MRFSVEPTGGSGETDVYLAREIWEGMHSDDVHIPKGAEQAYAGALMREYRGYVAAFEQGDVPQRVDYGTGRGYPRQQIPWYPTVALDLCDGCGACTEFCSFGVYRAPSDGKAIVTEPFRCQVGCSMCVNVCPPRAISFPPRTMLDSYRPRGQ